MLELDELAGQSAELLPAREALGGVNVQTPVQVGVAIAIDLGEGDADAELDQSLDASQK
ncbi:hypothetical protein [Parasphingorhabdus pacifica]